MMIIIIIYYYYDDDDDDDDVYAYVYVCAVDFLCKIFVIVIFFFTFCN